METSFDEGYGVVDAHAGFIAGNDRFDQFAARSAILLTERKRRRQHFARMKRLSADIRVVQIERADQDAVDEHGALQRSRLRIADHRGGVTLSESPANCRLG